MAAVRINTLGGQKDIREESRPAFRRTNKALNSFSRTFTLYKIPKNVLQNG